MSHNRQKKVAVINDFSGFGRCSIAVSMPIISYMRMQCCPVPTSIFSNHTGFAEYFYEDYTEKLPEYIKHWRKLNLKFEGITSGFLGSKEQIEIVRSFIREFKKKDCVVVIDPVMGDYGKLYPTYTQQMCHEMKKLVELADILTPNITECCNLTDIPYKQKWRKKELLEMAQMLSDRGPDKIVITGICQGQFIANYVYEKGREPVMLRTHKVGTERSGTGDIFSAIVLADAVNGREFQTSVKKASNFIKKCILKSMELNIPKTDGVCFEEILHTLKI